MLYSLIADAILILHISYILFVVFGGMLLFHWRWLWKLHIPMVFWGILVQYFVWTCPLTGWENYFRNLSGEAGYSDGFINYFLTAILYPDITSQMHTFIAIALLLINIFIYLKVLSKR